MNYHSMPDVLVALLEATSGDRISSYADPAEADERLSNTPRSTKLPGAFEFAVDQFIADTQSTTPPENTHPQ